MKSLPAIALLCLAFSDCSHQDAPLPTDQLPRLGDTQSNIESRFSARRADGDETGYELHLIDQFVRVSVLYSKDRRGTARAMQINVSNHDGVSDEALAEAKRQLLPPDVRVLHERDVSALVLSDGQGLGDGDDMAFLSSHKLGEKIASSTYYDHGSWISRACPSAAPGLIEEYTDRSGNQLNRIGFFSAYLDKCQEKML